ncbi:DUF4235 domain-containing protein [Rhodococcus pyridinivorans]|uniref:DUF4235 domain-containing protein n=1 Tax=Rhodococcus pyridinivorans TaxID=103816 RepID=A0A7M2XSC6_9NOCA|nr:MULTISPECIES: DUF4235 domain-containing protein [Rhodococcus]APE08951.1 hypothetical protein BO226_06775 [Rhodococcus sp. 2G]QOW00696.1 DUF4235 domain-containing protein [Rhodococcus pyridinivorans]WMM74699.1 DUF4235 domain-containing protein [Rhodococcus pyridinivorans]
MADARVIFYKPLALAASVGGGILAGAVFNQVWKKVGGSDERPEPQDLSQRTRDVLIAAALQGLIFGVVKAAVDRGTARGFQKVTHLSPE